MTTLNFTEFKDYIDKKRKGVIITAHQDPDLDAIGSCLALHFQLDRLGIPNTIWLADKIHKHNTYNMHTYIHTYIHTRYYISRIAYVCQTGGCCREGDKAKPAP